MLTMYGPYNVTLAFRKKLSAMSMETEVRAASGDQLLAHVLFASRGTLAVHNSWENYVSTLSTTENTATRLCPIYLASSKFRNVRAV
jgi:hypothetical protein